MRLHSASYISENTSILWLMKALLVLLLVLVASSEASAQTRIYTNSGSVYSGWMQYEDAQSVRMITSDSQTVTLTRDKISKIEYGQAMTSIELKPGDAIPGNITAPPPQTASSEPNYSYGFDYHPIDPQAPKRETPNVFMLGAAFGTPSGLLLESGVYSGKWSVRGSGMYLGSMSGVQVNLGYALKKSERYDIFMGIAAGTSKFLFEDELIRWTYIGPYGELNMHGFFLEMGLSVGRGTYTSPQMMGQIGYILEFEI
jgi:hypothetical protein